MIGANGMLAYAHANFDRAVALGGADFHPEIVAKIREPKERIEFRLAPQLSDDHLRIYKAFIVKHNDALGHATTQDSYFTGKPAILVGIPGRREAAMYAAVRQVCEAVQAPGTLP